MSRPEPGSLLGQSNRDVVVDYRRHLEVNAQWARDRLAKEARHIERRVGALAKHLESDTPVVIVNELGELQAQGPLLDTLCTAYVHAARALEDYDGFMERQV